MNQSHEPLRILLVEDDILLATLLQEVLGAQPDVQLLETATSAAQGLEAARRLQPDLVLLDIRLPDRSGLDMLKDLATDLPELRVLMLTLSDDMDSVLAA